MQVRILINGRGLGSEVLNIFNFHQPKETAMVETFGPIRGVTVCLNEKGDYVRTEDYIKIRNQLYDFAHIIYSIGPKEACYDCYRIAKAIMESEDVESGIENLINSN